MGSVSKSDSLMRAIVWVLVLTAGCDQDDSEPPCPDCAPPVGRCQPHPARDYDFEQDGVSYRIRDGNVYRVDGNGLELIQTLYDPDYFAKMYEVVDGRVWRLDGEDRYAVHDRLTDDFEPYAMVRDLFPSDATGWHHLTAQSPAAPTDDDYNALARCILDGSCDFIDNRLALTPMAASGQQALLFSAVAPTPPDTTVSKMSIRNELVCFAKGEELWLSFRAFSDAGMPATLADIESTVLKGYGGPRLTLSDGALGLELKFGDKPHYRQETPRAWPIGQWVAVKLRLVLDDTESGVIQVWQDGELVIDARGPNHPLPDIVLNALEIGISATLDAADLRIDDVRISREPL